MPSQRPLNHSIECASVNPRSLLDLADRQSSVVEFDRGCAILIALTRMGPEHAKVRAGPERCVEDFRSRALHGAGRLKTVLKLSGAESIAGAMTLPVASNSKSAERTELTSTG
jgi:hypothetical protein